jgi:hypothetical protein
MQKISITIDLGKLDKTRINTRTYENKEGEVITVKEYKMDIVPLTEPKLIKEGDTWRMMKTHFVSNTATKEEREAKTKMVGVGEGIMFVDKNEVSVDDIDQTPVDEIDDIPF